MSERKPGFVYIYSEILKQEIAVSLKTGITYCQDKVKYTPQEMQIICEDGGTLPLQVHLIKKVFEGSEVVKYAGDIPNAAGAASKDGEGTSQSNVDSSASKMECASEHGAKNESFELDIF
jgi:hypothetical protein